MWTEGASQARHVNMQVADVHKGLLSLSRCGGMGFESRIGRTMGVLIDEVSREVILLRRKGKSRSCCAFWPAGRSMKHNASSAIGHSIS